MKWINLIAVSLFLISCNFESPTQFTEEALNDEFISLDGTNKSLQEILNDYQGKKVFIDVWASWCSDCIVGMPIVKQIQSEFPDISYLFLSQDRTERAWKIGINKYDIQGDHYFIKEGSDGPFSDFLNSNWIPRYMVIDEQGDITLFKAKKATDKRIKEALK